MLEFTDQLTREENDEFVKANPLCNLLQSSSWADIKSNWDHCYTGVKKDGKVVASAMVLIKKLPLGFTLFYIPRGPIMDYKDQELVAYMLKELKKHGKKHHCLYIKMDPYILKNQYAIEDVNESISKECAQTMNVLRANGALHQGFTKDIMSTIQPRFQANVYAVENFEETLPRHTKRLMKDAAKRSVEIEMGGSSLVKEFAGVVAKTENRKKIALRNEEYFQKLMDAYGDDAKILLARVNVKKLVENTQAALDTTKKELAELPENQVKKRHRLEEQQASQNKDLIEYKEIAAAVDGQEEMVIAGCLSIKYGPTMEMLYAGMDERFKKFMPQYSIYVKQMKWAFENGCHWCNMGGVEGSLDDGLTKFKSNFNPTIDETIGEFDLPVNKSLYKASEMAYKLRKKMKVKA